MGKLRVTKLVTDFLTASTKSIQTVGMPIMLRYARRSSSRLLGSVVLAGALALAFSGPGSAQAVRPAPAASTSQKPVTPVAQPRLMTSRPVWAELTVQQQQALRPLAPGWDTISEAQKRKWLEISKNYPSLTPEGQLTMHSRMTEWVGMSPQQRAQARLNFAKTKELSKELTPDEKKAKWQSYQALSAEEKQKLAAMAPPKPTGAATAVKPVPTQKLAVIPPASASKDSKAPTRRLQPPQQGDSATINEAVSFPETSAPQR